MDPPTTFRFPPRDVQPLHPLSPERVNGRPSPTRSRRPDRDLDRDPDAKPPQISQSCSPTRKANLFADYAPLHTTPTKSSAFGAGALPQSPSLPEFTALRTAHVRTNSDVQGLVKRFETLDVRDKDGEVNALKRRAERAEMELQRAQIGREEAEVEVRKLREEAKDLRERDRRWAKRLEKVEADAKQDKDTMAQNNGNFTRAIRKKQKEAFNASKVALEVQEELHALQKRYEAGKMDHARDLEKSKKLEREAWDALNASRDQNEKLQEHCKILEQEKEVLKVKMDERQLAEAAAEGAIALPGSMDEDDDLLASPTKGRSPRKALMRSPLSDDKENLGVVTKKMLDVKRWQDEVEQERMKREAAEDMVDFLRMECAFKCCNCAVAAKHGRTVAITMDEILEASMERIRKDMKQAFSLPAPEHEDIDMDAELRQRDEWDPSEHLSSEAVADTAEEAAACDTLQPDGHEHEDLSMTLAGDAPEPIATDYEAPQHTVETAEQDVDGLPQDHEECVDSHVEDTTALLTHEAPTTLTQTPRPFVLRTITTTTQIPMHFTPVRKPTHHLDDIENQDPDCAVLDPHTSDRRTPNSTDKVLPFDREAALAAIAYRRGRAKSLANGHLTPRKQMVEGLGAGLGVEGGRRDVSAPVLGRGRVGTVSPMKGGSVGRAAGRAGGVGMGI